MVSFPSRSVSGNARYCELRRPWRQARSCNVAAASYIKIFLSLARGGAPAPLPPPPPPPPPWIRHCTPPPYTSMSPQTKSHTLDTTGALERLFHLWTTYLKELFVFGDPLERFDEVGAQAEIVPKSLLHQLPRGRRTGNSMQGIQQQ